MDENFEIVVQLTNDDGRALELGEVSIDAVLYTQGRVRYRFSVGKTDARGRVSVTFHGLEKLRLRNQAFSIMDYNTRLQECDSRISFIVPSLDELRKRQEAIEKWFPEDASKSAPVGESNNRKLRCRDLDVDVRNSAQQVSLMCSLSTVNKDSPDGAQRNPGQQG